MKELLVKELLKAINGELIHGSLENVINNACVDSRIAKEGDVFFALIGTSTDGHKYIGQVISNGAKAVVISNENELPKDLPDNVSVIKVSDTLNALQDLAMYHLDSLNLKERVAITGSVGKTSTRDMVYFVLSTKYKAERNKKNYNNETGLPLAILDFKEGTEVAVMEIALSSNGTTSDLARFTKPNHACFTNIGISHIEKFKEGRVGILKAKLGVTDKFNKDSKMVINYDDDLLSQKEILDKYNPITVGYRKDSMYRILEVTDNGALGINYKFKNEDKEYIVNLPVPGAHNAINATIALALGKELGVPLHMGIEGLKNLELTGNRLNVKKGNRVTVIDDSYNAAPMSMKSGVNTLMNTSKENRHIAILGDMFELGPESDNGHMEVGIHVAKNKVEETIFIGNNSKKMLEGWLKENEGSNILKESDNPISYRNLDNNTHVEYYTDKIDVLKNIKNKIKEGDTILVKASNGMKLGEIVEEILK